MTVRLYTPSRLKENEIIDIHQDQMHYCLHVLRLKSDDTVFVFNGIDGEFSSKLLILTKKKAQLLLQHQTKILNPLKPLMLVFSPIKQDRLNFMIEKATELGVTHLKPVITDYTQIHKINTERLLKIAIEAAEQSERLCIPHILKTEILYDFMTHHDFNEWPLACAYERCDIIKENNLEHIKGIVIGPEGGFSKKEADLLQSKLPMISLGNQILRAETAAIVGLDRLRFLNV